ncbi:hypothetical protein [Actinacidiphila bryophytorum]|uniref:hypothetical protein n=1 Tax=Actinacidiphila bryophytorum TaxID=1436133 RepID=UPI0021769C18|nr:hypothetical protein [Actinacidiphila bryophytorum]UWE08717.1 hypothetical protein NYE86_08285 [Actinacidiphila bryophytorum]
MRRLTVAGLALTLAFGVAGCGASHHRSAVPGAKAVRETAGGADADAAKAVVAMVDRTEGMHSVHVVSVEQRGKSKVHMSGLNAWGGADSGVDVTVAPSEFGLQGLNHQDRAEMRTFRGGQYVRIDPPASGPNKGKTWLRWSLDSTLGEGAAAAMSEAMGYSPVHRLLLMPSSGPVVLVGHETVDGRTAIHYRGTVPTDSRLVESRKVPATQRVDVWVGADGLPVRLVTDDGVQHNTQDFTGFGGAVHLQEPPAAQTIDASAPKGAMA